MPNPNDNLKLTGDSRPHHDDDLVMLDEDRSAAAAMFAQSAQSAQDTASMTRPSLKPVGEFTSTGQSRWLDRVPYSDRARGYATEARDRARGYATQARDRVGDQPLAALGVAVALGFIFGKLMRR